MEHHLWSFNCRHPDQPTSVRAAKELDVSLETYAALIAVYRSAGEDGLTDEEAAERSQIVSRCPWKRCNELRSAGIIRQTERTRVASSGRRRMVCVIA